VLGALDLEQALSTGVRAFEPGLLARANRGFLYIDEVNLLEVTWSIWLIDVAASGVNLVEREGLSVRHPARFVLVGSGNPEEGDLRPQLLDRFGLSVEIRTPKDLEQRIEIVRRRMPSSAMRPASLHSGNGRKRRCDVGSRVRADNSRALRSAMRRSNGRRGCAWVWVPTGCAASSHWHARRARWQRCGDAGRCKAMI